MNRVWLQRRRHVVRNVGLADAAHDFLTADQMHDDEHAGDVPLGIGDGGPEQGDTVIVSVSGRWAWMGAGLFMRRHRQSGFGLDVHAGAGVRQLRYRTAERRGCSVTGITASGGMLYVSPTPAIPTRCGRARYGSGVQLRPTCRAPSLTRRASRRVAECYTSWTARQSRLGVDVHADLWCAPLRYPFFRAASVTATGITASGGMLFIDGYRTQSRLGVDVHAELWCATLRTLPAERRRGRAGHHGEWRKCYTSWTSVPLPDLVWTCTLWLWCAPLRYRPAERRRRLR